MASSAIGVSTSNPNVVYLQVEVGNVGQGGVAQEAPTAEAAPAPAGWWRSRWLRLVQ